MYTLLLLLIYLAFISLGLPDSLIRLSLARDPSGASGTLVLCGGSDNDRFIWNNMFKSDV